MSTNQNGVAFVAEGIVQKVQGSSVGSRTTDTCRDPKRAPCCTLTALVARTAASSANAKVTHRLDPSEREHIGTGTHGARLMQSSSLRSQREPSLSAHQSSSDTLYAQKCQHALLPVVTSMLRHRTRAILRTSGRTSSTPPTYSGPSPSHHGPTPNLHADHIAHRSSGPTLRPASLHGHAPDQDYTLRYNSDVLRARTGPLRYAERLRRTPDVLRTSMRISTSMLDSLVIPGVLRTTPELIRTTAWILTFMLDSWASPGS
jgi:hypothetical protein